MTPRERYLIMVDYCKMKVQEKDWHGVCDAAMDIRDILAAHPEVESSQMPVICIKCLETDEVIE